MKPLKQKMSITLDPDLAADIQLLADYDDRSLSSYINLLLRKHAESKEDLLVVLRKRQKTLEKD